MRSALIFCERTGAWCIALGRWLQSTRMEIVETRSLAECREVLESWPASLLVLEATAENLPAMVSWLVRLERDFPHAKAAIVTERRFAACEWGVREAGAVAFVTSQRQLQPLADVAGLFFAAQQAPDQGLAERIWDSLPWRRRHTGTTPGPSGGPMPTVRPEPLNET